VCSTYGGGGCGKSTDFYFGNLRIMEDNIKSVLKGRCVRVSTGFKRLRICSSDGQL
jgi:hypothetical protein